MSEPRKRAPRKLAGPAEKAAYEEAADRNTPPTVRELMQRVMGEVRAVSKDDRNPQQGYNFRGIDAVINAVGPAFRRYGIVPEIWNSKTRYRDVQTSTGKPSREVTVKVHYRFSGPKGDYIKAKVWGESMDFGDKGTAKAFSVAYRIALLQVLCIPTGDTDPDAQTYERDHAQPQGKTDAEWLADAQFMVDQGDEPSLLELGRQVNAAGQWKGELKNQLLAMRQKLQEAQQAKQAEQEESPPAED